MINYTCICGVRYRYLAEIIQAGGTVHTGYMRNWFTEWLDEQLTFVCRCGAELSEQELLETYIIPKVSVP